MKYFIALVVCALAVGACAASTPPEPPCDPETVAAKLVECVAAVQACPPRPAPCPAQDACNAWADARRERCTGGK